MNALIFVLEHKGAVKKRNLNTDIITRDKIKEIIGKGEKKPCEVLDSFVAKMNGSVVRIFVDDLGHMKDLDVNEEATGIYREQARFFGNDTDHEIRGRVVVVPAMARIVS